MFVLSPDMEVTPSEQLSTLRNELLQYGTDLKSISAMAILSKCDTVTEEQEELLLATLPKGTMPLSSATGKGVQEFLERLGKLILQERRKGSDPS